MNLRLGPAWWQVIALALAAAFLAGATVQYFNNRTDEPNAADIGFLDDMTKHHQQAISMAFAYFHNGTAPQLPTTATEIIENQAGDLRFIRNLRGDWSDHDGATDGNVMAWMGHAMSLDQMPGYASNEDLRKLDTLNGRELDDLFTMLMIRHHFGGLEMAKAAKATADVAAVRDFADGIITAQSREINELNQWRSSANLPAVTSPR